MRDWNRNLLQSASTPELFGERKTCWNNNDQTKLGTVTSASVSSQKMSQPNILTINDDEDKNDNFVCVTSIDLMLDSNCAG